MSDKLNKHINGKPSKFKNTKKKQKFNTGFIVAMAICFVAVGAASWSTYRNITDYMNPVSTEGTDTEATQDGDTTDNLNANHNLNGIIDNAGTSSAGAAIEQLLSDIDNNNSVVSTDNTLNESTDTVDTESVDTSSEVSTDTENTIVSDKYLFPVGQQVIKEYSGEELVYSKTMGDWRAHLGTDFYAEKGTKVKPLTTGVVTEIYTDGLLGVTVVIDHGNGVKAYYSGLGSTTLVNVGDSVGVGDFIGSVNVVPSESLDEPHLHLGVKVNDEWVNPMDLL